jgi:hypothetical protein
MTVILDGIFERKYLVCDTRPVGQDPAVEVLAQIPLDEARDGIPVRFGLLHARKLLTVNPFPSLIGTAP